MSSKLIIWSLLYYFLHSKWFVKIVDTIFFKNVTTVKYQKSQWRNYLWEMAPTSTFFLDAEEILFNDKTDMKNVTKTKEVQFWSRFFHIAINFAFKLLKIFHSYNVFKNVNLKF